MKKPRKYQKRITNEAVNKKAVALCVGMGLGKTRAVLNALVKILKQKKHRVLLVGPLHVVESTWPDEIEKWKVPLSYSLMRGTPAQRLAAFEADADIYAINFEMLPWLATLPIKEFKSRFSVLVIDELTKVKSTKSYAYRLLKGRRQWFDRHIGMTGIVTPESYTDLYGQMTTLVKIWETKKDFLDKHFVDESHDPRYQRWRLRNKKQAKKIEKAVAPYVLSMETEDYLEIPEMTFQDVWVDLPKKLRKRYDLLEDQMYFECEDGRDDITTDTISATRIKLRQVMSGFIYDEEGKALVFNDFKFKTAKNMLEDIPVNDPVLMMYQFIEERNMIEDKLGGVRLKKREHIKRWNKGKIPLMIGHPRSMGHGLNLQMGGHNLFWYSLPWSAEEYRQSNARLHRMDQQHTVVVHRLLIRDTIDEVLVQAHRRKHNTHKQFVKAMRKYRDRKN